MKYTLSKKYDTLELQAKIMGPNPVKLEEELLLNHQIPEKALVCDLGRLAEAGKRVFGRRPKI